MPRNSSGTYTLPEDPFVPNTTILSSAVNSDNDDIGTALTDSLSRSGKGGMQAALDMGTHKITNLVAGASSTDAANYGQVQPGPWVAAGGTADAITATYSPAFTSLTDGMIVYVRAGAANATTTPTFSPNGLTAHTITKDGGSPLAASDILQNSELILRYNLGHTRWELLNPAVYPGAIAGIPQGKTTSYSVVNADKGKTFVFGGNAYYTVTIGAPAGFDADFQVRLINNDGRGKRIAPSGITSFILWPGQSTTFVNVGGAWAATPLAQRFITSSGITVYVDSSLGSDSNDGLAPGSGALATIGQAYAYVRDLMDHVGGSPNIQLAGSETFSVGAGLNVNYPLVGAKEFFIGGTGATSIVQCDSGGTVFAGRDLSTCTVLAMKIRTQGNGSTGISVTNSATIDHGANITWDDFPLGVCATSSTAGTINFLANYTVGGTTGFGAHISANFAGYINYGAIAVAVSNSIAFNQWAVSTNLGVINSGGAPATFSGAGSGAGSTGTKYAVVSNSIINSTATTYPGATAGSSGSGGIYS